MEGYQNSSLIVGMSCRDVHNHLVSHHTGVFDHIVVSSRGFVAHFDYVIQGLGNFGRTRYGLGWSDDPE